MKDEDERGTYPGRVGASVADGTACAKVLWQPRQRGEGENVAGGAGQGASYEMRLEGAGARARDTGGATEVLLVATPSSVSAVVTGLREATSLDESRSWSMCPGER